MKKVILVLTLGLLFLFVGNTFANVMPFGITISTTGGNLTINYRLNETCSSVTVLLYGPLPSESVIYSMTGGVDPGLNFVTLNGYASMIPTGTIGIKVVAVDAVGHASWTQISSDTTETFMFYGSRGMKVNKNQGSPYFGLTYVTQGYDGVTTATGRPNTKGIYAVYPDGSDPFSIGTVAITGGIAWASSSNNPYGVFIGTDDKVWISSYADANSGLWRAENADLSGTFTAIMDNTGASSGGLVSGLHGNITGILVEGTGANTIIYTYDEDMPTAPSIWRYDIGNGPFPWTTSPTVWIDKSVLPSYLVNCAGANIYKDSQGRWWTNNYRAIQGSPNLIAFSAARDTVVWDSKGVGSAGGDDPLVGNYGGFVIDEARNRIIYGLATSAGSLYPGFAVFPFGPSLPEGNLSSVLTYVLATAPINGNTRAIDIDGAGNVFTVDSNNELVRIYSPPDGPNAFTTQAGYTVDNGTAFEITPPGPFTVSVGQTKDFTVSGGVAPYTWSLSTTGVGSLDTTAGTAVTFTGTGAGTVDVIVTDSYTPTPQQKTVTITVNPTGAPLYIESDNNRNNRFEMFE